MKASIKDLVLLHLLLFINTFGGICSKMAARQPVFSFAFFAFYGTMLLILAIYAVFWQQIIKKMPLSTAYLNKPVAMFWSILWGTLIFHEHVTLKMLAGAIVTIAGIVMVVCSDE